MKTFQNFIFVNANAHGKQWCVTNTFTKYYFVNIQRWAMKIKPTYKTGENILRGGFWKCKCQR